MVEFEDKILEQIKEEKITPRPRWEFLVRDYVVWAMFGLLVLVGSIAVSIFIFMLTDQDWDIYKNMGKSFGEFFLMSLPYFWIALIVAFSIFAWYDLKKTRSGYKYTFTKIGLVNIGLSIVIGLIFFYSGVGARIERVFANGLPFYNMMNPMRAEKIWDNPEKGLVIGEIIEFINGEDFSLRDPGNKEWIIDCINCIWRGGAKPDAGAVVKILGKQVDEDTFQTVEIRLWKDVRDGGIKAIVPGIDNMPLPMEKNLERKKMQLRNN